MSTKIRRISVTNLKAVAEQTADFNGCTAIITGGNNQGKTTLCRVFIDRMRGLKPENIIRIGEPKGGAVIELMTGERFEWEVTPKGEKMTYVSEKNIPAHLSKAVMQTYFPPVFDVDTFLTDGPAKQKATLQKLSGIDFTEIEQAYKAAYEARTYANKVVVTEKAKLTAWDQNMPREEVRIDAIAAELSGIEAHNMRREQFIERLKAKEDAVTCNEAEIKQLQKRIEMLQNSNEAYATQITEGKAWLNNPANMVKTNAAELKNQLAEAENRNREIRANNAAFLQNKAYDKAVRDAAEADAEVKRIEAEKAEVLRSSVLPDGFGFTEGGITYNGLPFDRAQLSSSAIYIAALKLAAISLGEVKTLHFDASFLDRDSLAEIEAWAVSQDLQLLIERPDWDCGPIRYEIVEPKEPYVVLVTPVPEGVVVERG